MLPVVDHETGKGLAEQARNADGGIHRLAPPRSVPRACVVVSPLYYKPSVDRLTDRPVSALYIQLRRLCIDGGLCFHMSMAVLPVVNQEARKGLAEQVRNADGVYIYE